MFPLFVRYKRSRCPVTALTDYFPICSPILALLRFHVGSSYPFAFPCVTFLALFTHLHCRGPLIATRKSTMDAAVMAWKQLKHSIVFFSVAGAILEHQIARIWSLPVPEETGYPCFPPAVFAEYSSRWAISFILLVNGFPFLFFITWHSLESTSFRHPINETFREHLYHPNDVKLLGN